MGRAPLGAEGAVAPVASAAVTTVAAVTVAPATIATVAIAPEGDRRMSANPAGNACLCDSAFVANRFRVAAMRRPVAA